MEILVEKINPDTNLPRLGSEHSQIYKQYKSLKAFERYALKQWLKPGAILWVSIYRGASLNTYGKPNIVYKYEYSECIKFYKCVKVIYSQ